MGATASKYGAILITRLCMDFFHHTSGFQTGHLGVRGNGYNQTRAPALHPCLNQKQHDLHAGLKPNNFFLKVSKVTCINYYTTPGHLLTTAMLVHLRYFPPKKTMNFTQNYLWPHKTKIFLHKRLQQFMLCSPHDQLLKHKCC